MSMEYLFNWTILWSYLLHRLFTHLFLVCLLSINFIYLRLKLVISILSRCLEGHLIRPLILCNINKCVQDVYLCFTSFNPITDGVQGHLKVTEGAYQAPHFMKALEGHRHKIFRVHHFKWENTVSDNGTMKKKITNLLPIACGSHQNILFHLEEP